MTVKEKQDIFTVFPIREHGEKIHPRSRRYRPFWKIIESNPRFQIEPSLRVEDIMSKVTETQITSIVFIGMPNRTIEKEAIVMLKNFVSLGGRLFVVAGGGNKKTVRATRDLLSVFGAHFDEDFAQSRSHLPGNKAILLIDANSTPHIALGKNRKIAMRMAHPLSVVNPTWFLNRVEGGSVCAVVEHDQGRVAILGSDYLLSTDPESGLTARSNHLLVGRMFDELTESRNILDYPISQQSQDSGSRRIQRQQKVIPPNARRRTPVEQGVLSICEPTQIRIWVSKKTSSGNEKRIWEGKAYCLNVSGCTPSSMTAKPDGAIQMEGFWNELGHNSWQTQFKLDPVYLQNISQWKMPTSLVAIEVECKSGKIGRVQVRAMRKFRHWVLAIVVIAASILATLFGLLIAG